MTIEMQNTGDSRARREILAGVEHVLSNLAGEWRVSIVGSRADDNWEMKVEGPRGVERSYTLVGEAGEHQPGGNIESAYEPAARERAMIYHTGLRCPTVEADIAGLSWDQFFEAGGTNDEQDSEFESQSQRAHFASVEQDQETKHCCRNHRIAQSRPGP